MKKERVVLFKKLSEFDASPYFRRLCGVDPENVPPKYGDGVASARQALSSLTEIAIAYRCDDILCRAADEVSLSSGAQLRGNMPLKVLKDSQEVISYVISLKGFSEANSDDMLLEYFMDAWGSAYVEAAQAWLAGEFQARLSAEGKKRTHLWCPGQHGFELSNQRALFEILRPEEFGCTLTNRLMMVPVKAASGIIGVVDEGCTDLPKPCDYCKFKPTCPASEGGCSAL